MPKKENAKKVAGNAKKAEAADAKARAEQDKKDAAEAAKWGKGSKDDSKREAAEQKKREAAAKKAEKEALLKAEEASLKTVKTNPKAGSKKEKAPLPKRDLGAALSGLDAPADDKPAAALHATGIDDALDALSIAQGKQEAIDRHPERRFKAAYAAYEERRIPEVREEHKGLRLGQIKDLIRKEFERSEENPFNKVSVSYDATRDEIAEKKRLEKEKTERRLAMERK